MGAFRTGISYMGDNLNVNTFNPEQYGFVNTIWNFSVSIIAPSLFVNGYLIRSFPSKTIEYKGVDFTLEQAKRQSFYPTFPFATTWAIIEDETYPFLLQVEGEYIDDPALTSRKIYVFVDESMDGSLFYDGKVYRSLKRTISFDSITGTAGSVITHQYGGVKLKDSDNNPYVFVFSGVQDPARPGGYGSIQPMTERSVQLLSDRSNNVAFYYAVSLLPPYDYLMRISTYDGLFHIALYKDSPTSIKCVMGDGEVVDVGLVLLDDANASPIRVMTQNGLMALERVEV